MTSTNNVGTKCNEMVVPFDDLQRELGSVLSWYSHLDAVGRLNCRSETLAEAARRVFPQSCHTGWSVAVESAFREFQRERQRILRQDAPRTDSVTSELVRSRSLLVVDWSASLFDGAVSPETAGFIDDDGMPGWDTWLTLASVASSYGKTCLICWVPRELTDRVSFGIEVDAAASMSWVTVNAVDRSLSLLGWGSGRRVVPNPPESC